MDESGPAFIPSTCIVNNVSPAYDANNRGLI